MSVGFRIGSAAFLATALFVACGCGANGGQQRVIVSGKIDYQGEPIKEGKIRFTPINGTRGQANFALINNGEYRITGRGGVQNGTFRVEVLSYRPIPGATPYTEEQADGHPEIQAGDLPIEQYIPPKYNKKSTLEVTIDVDGGEVTKNFNLT